MQRYLCRSVTDTRERGLTTGEFLAYFERATTGATAGALQLQEASVVGVLPVAVLGARTVTEATDKVVLLPVTHTGTTHICVDIYCPGHVECERGDGI